MRRPLPEKPPERTPIISVPALGPAFRVRGARRPYLSWMYFQAPVDLRGRVRPPILAGRGHLLRRQRLGDAVRAAVRVLRVPPPARLLGEDRVQAWNWEPSSQPMSFILRFAILFASSTLAFSPSWSPAEHVAADEEPPPAPWIGSLGRMKFAPPAMGSSRDVYTGPCAVASR